MAILNKQVFGAEKNGVKWPIEGQKFKNSKTIVDYQKNDVRGAPLCVCLSV